MINAVLLKPLARRERVVVILILVGFVAFGAFVEKRTAYMSRRMGDLGCYLRAAWAVRTGGRPMYHATCDNGWHYNYPPLFAILLAPLGDPPARDVTRTAAAAVPLLGSPGVGPLQGAVVLASSPQPLEPDIPTLVSYPVSTALFYALNLVCLALSVHLLASALEASSAHEAVRNLPGGCRRWWLFRLAPVLLVLPPLGHTLVRGQANVVLLLCVCGFIAGLMRRHDFRAGLWLAGAICLKIFPAFLILIPLWRRSARCLAGCGAGLVVGLGVIPVLALGPAQTATCYRELAQVLVGPALDLGGDGTRAKELIEVTATDNQAFKVILHNTMYPNRLSRPNVPLPWVPKAHWLIGGFFTLLTFAFAARGGPGPLRLPLFVGALTLIMLLMSPVCHSHYFTLSIPAILGLLALSYERDRVDSFFWVLVGLYALVVTGAALPLLPGLEQVRDLGLVCYTQLALWLVTCVALGRVREGRAEGEVRVSRSIAA